MVFGDALMLQDFRKETSSVNLGPPRQSRLKAAAKLKEFPHMCKDFMTALMPIRLAFFGGGQTAQYTLVLEEPCWCIAPWQVQLAGAESLWYWFNPGTFFRPCSIGSGQHEVLIKFQDISRNYIQP